jgi:hypothetical protein
MNPLTTRVMVVMISCVRTGGAFEKTCAVDALGLPFDLPAVPPAANMLQELPS